jgi:hypothetical protein
LGGSRFCKRLYTIDLDVLLIQEPPVTAYRIHVNHRLWQLE